MRRLEHARAIVLENRKSGESDNLITVLLEDGQLQRVILHGLRASRKRNKRLAEPGTLIDLVYYPHDSGPASMKEAQVLESYDDLKQGYRNLEWLAFVLELSSLAARQDAGQALFVLLQGMLETMQSISRAQRQLVADQGDELLFYFYMTRLLYLLGLLGDSSHCAACGQELREKASWIKPEVYFYCEDCSLEATPADFWMARVIAYCTSNRYSMVAEAFQRDCTDHAARAVQRDDQGLVNPHQALHSLGRNLRDALLYMHDRPLACLPEALQGD